MKNSTPSPEIITCQLTEKELEFLRVFQTSDFYDGIDHPIWDYSVNENLSFSGKTRSGVLSSLQQKGIINVTKKEKGDIAGVYQITNEAQNTPFIQEIFGIITPVVETPVVNPKTATGEKYIVPTRKNPLFQATCSYFGTIETNVYKNALIGNTTTSVFACSYVEAITELHNWIETNWWCIDENPKCKFEIMMLDGSVDKYGEIERRAVYTISARKAGKLLTKKIA